jgi:hypothetical protein
MFSWEEDKLAKTAAGALPPLPKLLSPGQCALSAGYPPKMDGALSQALPSR